MKCVKVPLKQLNDTRIELMEKGLMNMEYRIKAEDEFGYIPVNANVEGYEIVCMHLEAMKKYMAEVQSTGVDPTAWWKTAASQTIQEEALKTIHSTRKRLPLPKMEW